MTDTRFRELERRWQQTGSPDDEEAFLAERVRIGRLSTQHLTLVRFLRVRSDVVPTPTAEDLALHPYNVEDRRRRVDGVDLALNDRHVTRLVQLLLACGQESWTRTGLTLTRRGLEVWLRSVDDATEADRLAPCRLVATVRDRLLNGASIHFDQEAFATDQVMERQHYRWGPTEVLAPMSAVQAAQNLGRLASLTETAPTEGPESARVLLGNMIYEGCVVLGMRLDVDRGRETPQLRPVTDLSAGLNTVLHALAEELVPWALGTGDPVRSDQYLARLQEPRANVPDVTAAPPA